MSGFRDETGAGQGAAEDRRPRRSRWSIRVGGALIAGAAIATGCGTGEPSTDAPRDELTREEFVEIAIALREAERAVAQDDSAAVLFAARRAQILARHETTEAELEAFLVKQGDLDALQAMWDTIAQRLKHVPAAPGAPGPDLPTPPTRPMPGEQRLH